MQKVIKSDEFTSFSDNLDQFVTKLKEFEEDFTIDATTKYDLEKYHQIIEGSDEEVLNQYETWYDQLSEVVINNNSAIKKSNEMINKFTEFIKKTTKEKSINDETKQILNELVDKMIFEEKKNISQKEEEIRINELERQQKEAKERKDKLDSKLEELYKLKYQYDDKDYKVMFQLSNEEQVTDLSQSINLIKEWTCKQKCSILFDSKIDGDGSDGVLKNKILNKKNLCFIHFDQNKNVFGGYVNVPIVGNKDFITDQKAFLFSLIRNGQLKNIKYDLMKNEAKHSFYLNLDDSSDLLYCFGYKKLEDQFYSFGQQFQGLSDNSFQSIFSEQRNQQQNPQPLGQQYYQHVDNDIRVSKIGCDKSYCEKSSFDYKADNSPFINTNMSIFGFNYFVAKRIIIFQMS
ncbi:TLDc domain-containing protein [Entamoeba marina]